MKSTSISLRAMRAGIVRDAITENPGDVHCLEDIANLQRLADWSPIVIDVAVADLVADGVLVDDALGVPLVRHDRTGQGS